MVKSPLSSVGGPDLSANVERALLGLLIDLIGELHKQYPFLPWLQLRRAHTGQKMTE